MREQEVMILIAEDDPGHVRLIQKNLKRVGISNQFLFFHDGQTILDFLFRRGEKPHRISGTAYLLLLDIRMPKVDGIEVLRQIKRDLNLRKIPVIMLTTTDNPREVEYCHSLGCSFYITKPIDYAQFVEALRRLGLFLKIVQLPTINGE